MGKGLLNAGCNRMKNMSGEMGMKGRGSPGFAPRQGDHREQMWHGRRGFCKHAVLRVKMKYGESVIEGRNYNELTV